MGWDAHNVRLPLRAKEEQAAVCHGKHDRRNRMLHMDDFPGKRLSGTPSEACILVLAAAAMSSARRKGGNNA